MILSFACLLGLETCSFVSGDLSTRILFPLNWLSSPQLYFNFVPSIRLLAVIVVAVDINIFICKEKIEIDIEFGLTCSHMRANLAAVCSEAARIKLRFPFIELCRFRNFDGNRLMKSVNLISCTAVFFYYYFGTMSIFLVGVANVFIGRSIVYLF